MDEYKEKKEGKSKTYRMLNIYEKLNKGEVRSKQSLSRIYEVDEKTIQRDVKELKSYLEKDENDTRTIIYNKNKKGYQMINSKGFKFADKDIFALCKIILESRAFSNQEMDRILDILNSQCEDSELLKKIISNERFNYIAPKHNKNIIDFI